MERLTAEQWCRERSAASPETELDKLSVQTFWVRMMKTVLPVPELDSVLGLGPSGAFLYCGPAGTGKHTLAQAVAGSLARQGYTFYQLTGRDLSEDMEPRLETLLRQVDPEHPAVLLCEDIGSCADPEKLASCLAEMIPLCQQMKLPVLFLLIEEDEAVVPATLLRKLTVCRFALPDLKEREAFYSGRLGARFPLKPGLSTKDLAVAAEGLDLRQLNMSLQLMLRGLKEQALIRYKTHYAMAQDAIRNMELVVDMGMFRQIVEHLKTPKKETQPPIQIVQTVAPANAATGPVTQDKPESKTERLKQSKSMSDFFDNL